MASSDHNYRAFLIRLWRDAAGGRWRVMLEDAHTGEAHGFPSMAHLFAFLEEQAAEDAPSASGPGGSSLGP